MNVYDDDGQEEKSASLEALSHKFPFTKYFINDIDSESVNSLQSRIASLNLGAATQVKVTCSDCNLAVDSIVSSIGRAPCVNLAVLDGFGIECHWSTVKKLASIERIDLVILFPGNMTLVRNAERWSQEENDARLDLFMPDKSWRTVWSDRRLTGGKAAPDFLNLYVNGLTTLHYRRDLIHTKLIKSETGQPLYHLVFASRHPLGAKFWQQAVGRDDAGQTSMLFENI
jgi:three-Cys-motif partner protein